MREKNPKCEVGFMKYTQAANDGIPPKKYVNRVNISYFTTNSYMKML